MNDQPLILAVPSKGRLQENASAFFSRAGLNFEQSRGSRDYRGVITGIPNVEILFLSASEIVSQLANGSVHLGITGEDLIREQIPHADDVVEFLTPLGFGNANVVVAAPQAWIDARSMRDIDEIAADMRAHHGRKMRVATKYVNLTRRFFAEKGITDYVIVESLGATEGAPSAGAAELIVDITSSGATLSANALKIIEDGVILRSEANLIASVTANWSLSAREAAKNVLTRIAAEGEARATREIHVALDGQSAASFERTLERFELSTPYIVDGHVAVLRCSASQVFDIVHVLQDFESSSITVRKVDYLFHPTNELLVRLLARIS